MTSEDRFTNVPPGMLVKLLLERDSWVKLGKLLKEPDSKELI